MTGLRTGKSSRNSKARNVEPAGAVLPWCQRALPYPETVTVQPVAQLFLLRNKQPGLVAVSLCRYHHDRKVSRKDWAAQGDGRKKKSKLYWKHPKNVLKNILFSLLCLIYGIMCLNWISKLELHSYHQIWGSQKFRLRKSCKRLILFLMFDVITNKFWDLVLFIEIILVWVDSWLKIVWEGRPLKY